MVVGTCAGWRRHNRREQSLLYRELFHRLQYSGFRTMGSCAVAHPRRATPSIYQSTLCDRSLDARLGHAPTFIPSNAILVRYCFEDDGRNRFLTMDIYIALFSDRNDGNLG
jgi:hypothetical protein